jgi:branched-chain amino acid aminotransferase
MPITPTPKIWMNGNLVDWADAKVHVLTHTLHYGTGVFEGIRAYETDKGPAVFRLTDHMVRLHNSAKIMGMPMPYSVDELVEATRWVSTRCRARWMSPSCAGRGARISATTRWKKACG